MHVQDPKRAPCFLCRIRPQVLIFCTFFSVLFFTSFVTNSRHIEPKSVNNMTADQALKSYGDVDVGENTHPGVFIEINIPATEMTLYENGVELFKRPVAIGRNIYPTPEQEASIDTIEWNPWWYPPKSAWARKDKPTPPGPRNPLGPVKLRIGQGGEILLHGTNKSSTVGRPASHGCMRMFNADAKSLAWYLQSRFSDKSDPKLLEMYEQRNRSTFRVKLDTSVPVNLVYDPVVYKDNKLILYPDHYNKFREKRKAAILTELIEGGIEIEMLDDKKIEQLSRNWPSRYSEISISDLLIDSPVPNLLSAPECS